VENQAVFYFYLWFACACACAFALRCDALRLCGRAFNPPLLIFLFCLLNFFFFGFGNEPILKATSNRQQAAGNMSERHQRTTSSGGNCLGGGFLSGAANCDGLIDCLALSLGGAGSDTGSDDSR
jgi:hypothetical protein